VRELKKRERAKLAVLPGVAIEKSKKMIAIFQDWRERKRRRFMSPET
jgi:hypothetical protein